MTLMKSARFSWRLAVAALLIVGAVFYAGMYAGRQSRPTVELIGALRGKEPPQELGAPLVDFVPFWKVWSVLDEKYVTSATTTSAQEKVWGAISGLVNSLKDPYTVFLPPEDAKIFESEIAGSFEGVGMELGIKDETLTVIAPLKGTPAERAGILPGDKILKINDGASANIKVEQAVKLIRGKRGTEVRLTLQRNGRKEPFEIKIIRDVIDIPTIDTEVRSRPPPSGAPEEAGLRARDVFVIKLYNFSASSPRVFRDALREFVGTGGDKLIIDLRGNPGGFLEAAADMASWFLPAGAVVVTEDYGRKGESRVHRSRGYNVFTDRLKLVILINSGSASASEILAGALREHGKARLVGAKTFGKGSVQELVKIEPDSALKVTVARWLTPKGASISEGGLAPDVEVKMAPEDIEKKRDPQMEKAIELLTKP